MVLKHYICSVLILAIMELRIKELCRQKGMKMTDIAEKIGVDYSNLMASLKKNPTLNRLTDVANALGVSVAELFEKPSGKAKLNGYVEINGEVRAIRNADDWFSATSVLEGVPVIPLYTNIAQLRKDLSTFVHQNVRDLKLESSLWGRVGTHEVFCLSSLNESCEDGDNFVDSKQFILSLLSSGETLTYDLMEYGDDGNYDVDGEQGLLFFIRADIEHFMESSESSTE